MSHRSVSVFGGSFFLEVHRPTCDQGCVKFADNDLIMVEYNTSNIRSNLISLNPNISVLAKKHHFYENIIFKLNVNEIFEIFHANLKADLKVLKMVFRSDLLN